MALIPCPECNKHEIKKELGSVCPECGFKINDKNKNEVYAKNRTQKEWFWGILGLNLVMFILLSLSIGLSAAKGDDLNNILCLIYGVLTIIILINKYISIQNKLLAVLFIFIFVCILKFA